MASDTTDRQLVWVLLAVLVALVVLPGVGMASGMMGAGWVMGGEGHGMWNGNGPGTGWWFVVGIALQLLFLAALAAAGYLLYRAFVGRADGTDPALEELRRAYARGDLSDEEYERRRDRLEREE